MKKAVKINTILKIKNLLTTILLTSVLILFVFNSKVEAARGCCSWHGGVCGCDTNVGRQICCDGTYSPSCTCAFTPNNYMLLKPKPTFPQINAYWEFFSNDNGTWDIKMELLDNQPTKYSAVISKCQGCDPGPLVDFYTKNFYFKNITQGRWYVNVKKEINGYWSNAVYYTIDVPEWQPPTPTLALEESLQSNLSQFDNENQSNNNKNNSFPWFIIVILVGEKILIAYYLVKEVIKDE